MLTPQVCQILLKICARFCIGDKSSNNTNKERNNIPMRATPTKSLYVVEDCTLHCTNTTIFRPIFAIHHGNGCVVVCGRNGVDAGLWR